MAQNRTALPSKIQLIELLRGFQNSLNTLKRQQNTMLQKIDRIGQKVTWIQEEMVEQRQKIDQIQAQYKRFPSQLQRLRNITKKQQISQRFHQSRPVPAPLIRRECHTCQRGDAKKEVPYEIQYETVKQVLLGNMTQMQAAYSVGRTERTIRRYLGGKEKNQRLVYRLRLNCFQIKGNYERCISKQQQNQFIKGFFGINLYLVILQHF